MRVFRPQLASPQPHSKKVRCSSSRILFHNMVALAYFLVSFVVLQQKYGHDIPNIIVGIDRILSDYYDNAQVLHAFKVPGESKILAIIEVSNSTALECIITKILDLGSIVVDTQPIISYESFARSLGVSYELTQPANVILQRENLYLLTLTIGYNGKTTAEYLALRKRSAEQVLSVRNSGILNAVIYKNLAEHVEHFFVNGDDPVMFDVSSYAAPLIQENGANVKMETEVLEFLDDYAALIHQKNDLQTPDCLYSIPQTENCGNCKV